MKKVFVLFLSLLLCATTSLCGFLEPDRSQVEHA